MSPIVLKGSRYASLSEVYYLQNLALALFNILLLLHAVKENYMHGLLKCNSNAGIPKLEDIMSTTGRMDNNALRDAVFALRKAEEMLKEIRSYGQVPYLSSLKFPCTPQEGKSDVQTWGRAFEL